MPLAAGQTLSFYEILSPLGAGGMGEVYLARDTRLGREVAIKVLPEDFADDDDRLQRFEREARALASLNHPGIAGIHGVDQEGDAYFLALELVPGEDLAERIARGPLRVDEAIDVCRQIAEALEAAHDAGVMHRDLKPGNVRVTPKGVVKILDFGLAKPTRAARTKAGSGGARPDSFSVTTEGMILGTPAYMSPEQARGKQVDRRTDIWAFGCVLHECLTGKRAFEGEGFSELVVAILERHVDLEALPAGTPPRVRGLIARCLEKNPRARLRDIGEARVLLERPGAAVEPPTERASAWRGPLGWTAAAVVSALLGALLTLLLVPRDTTNATPAEPMSLRTLTFSGTDGMPSASPDGSLVAFASERDGTSRIWLKQLSTGGEQVLTDGRDFLPRFAPDGASVLFLRDVGDRQDVYRQTLVGGEARKIVEDAVVACWSPDGARIGIARNSGEGGRDATALISIDARTRDELELFRTDGLIGDLRWSPDGRELSAVWWPSGLSADQSALVVVPAEGGAVERYSVPGAAAPSHAWIGGGRRVVYTQGWSAIGDQADLRSRFVLWDLDHDTHRTLFNAEGPYRDTGTSAVSLGTVLSVAGDGALVYDVMRSRELLWEQEIRGGVAVAPGTALLTGDSRDRQPVYGPDGSRLRFTSNRSGNLDLWELDLESGDLHQLTDDPAQDWDPAFAGDGEGLLWSSDRGGCLEVWSADAGASGARQLSHDGVDAENPTLGGGGEWIVYWSGHPDHGGVWRMRSDGSEATRLTTGGHTHTEVSRDGRWVGYVYIDPSDLRVGLAVIEVATGDKTPFEVVIPMGSGRNHLVTLGRMRWVEAGVLSDSAAIAFVGADEEGRTGVFIQDFDDENDTSATRRRLAGFDDHLATASFDIAPDGSRITLSMLEVRRRLMLAEAVPGLLAPTATE